MYWWRVSKLAEDLREGRVEEKERFKYYIAFIVLDGVVLELARYFPETFNMVKFMSRAAILIINITGTMLCYRTNRSGDNADFIGRMVCLSWPVGIKVFVLFSAISLVVANLFGASFSESDVKLFIAIFGGLFEISFYWLLYKYVRLVAHPNEAA